MWVGFPARDSLPDEAIENGLNDALSNQIEIYNPTYAFEVDADHNDYNNKSEGLDAYYDGTHPALDEDA